MSDVSKYATAWRRILGCALLGIAIGGPVPARATLVSSILPSSRSVEAGSTATVFATLINASDSAVSGCSVAPLVSLPLTFSFQALDGSLQPAGAPDTPVAIAAGQAQNFVLSLQPATPFPSTEIEFLFECDDVEPAATLPGINSLLLTASGVAAPDIIALGATLGNDGIVDVPTIGGSGAFSVAITNNGAASAIRASADTGPTALPTDILICETNPGTGACLASPAGSVTRTIGAQQTATFGVFVASTGTLGFDPAARRVYVRFTDGTGALRGATSVAVRSADTAATEIEIADETEILDQATGDALDSISEDNSRLTFSGSTPQLNGLLPGDIFVTGIRPQIPDGFLGRIDTVTVEESGTVVQILPASVDDAIEAGDIIVTPNLGGGTLLPATQPPAGTPSGGEKTSAVTVPFENLELADGLTLNGTLSIEAGIHFEAAFADGGLQRFAFQQQLNRTLDLSIDAVLSQQGLAEERKLATVRFPPIPVGEFLVITPEMEVMAGIAGDIASGTTLSVSQSANAGFGAAFFEGGWHPSHTYSGGFNLDQPQIGGDATVRIYLKSTFNYRINGVRTLETAFRNTIDLDADATAYPAWVLSGGAEGSVSVAGGRLSPALPDFEATVLVQDRTLSLGPPRMLSASTSCANDATLQWDTSYALDVSFNLYAASVPGVGPSNYSNLPDGKKYTAVASPAAIGDLTPGQTYYFAATAVDAVSGAESPASQEVSVTVGCTPADFAGLYEGTFSGDEQGAWVVAIDPEGIIRGAAEGSGGTLVVNGSVEGSGQFMFATVGGSATTGATFTGTLTQDGSLSGGWENAAFGLNGTFTGMAATDDTPFTWDSYSVGDFWLYDVQDSGGDRWQTKKSVDGLEAIHGVMAFQLAYYDSDYENLTAVDDYDLISFDADYLYLHGWRQVGDPPWNDDPLGLTDFSPPWRIRRQLMPGETSVASATGTDPLGNQALLTLRVTHLGHAEVSVPAGTFQEAARLLFSVEDGGSVGYSVSWDVQGVGTVKERQGDETSVLISYSHGP